MPVPRPVRDRLFAHALAAYAETLVEGRRVLFLGETDRELGERLLELGARAVHVFDPDPARASEAEAGPRTRGLVVQALPAGDFDVREGAFDVALVPDLAIIGDVALWLSRLRRVLGADGVLVGATAREGGPRAAIPYNDFYDALALQFAEVRLLGSVPWSGLALAELGNDEGAPDVSIDTQLAGTPPAPDAFVAIASQSPVPVDPYVILQLPHEEPVAAPALVPAPPPSVARREVSERPPVDPAAFAEMQLRAEVLAKELERTRDTERRLTVDNEALRTSAFASASEDRAEIDLERRTRKKAELELALVREELQALRSAVVRPDIEETVSIGTELTKALGLATPPSTPPSSGSLPTMMPDRQQGERLDRSHDRIHGLESELAHSRALLLRREEEHATEVVAFEALLADRAKELRTATTEIAHLRSTGRALLSELEELRRRAEEIVPPVREVPLVSQMPPTPAPAPAPAPSDEVKFESFAVDLARRDGELVALEWRIAELEEKLAMAEGGARSAAGGGAEVAVLREALAKEHALRVEQATLLEQVESRLRALRGDVATTTR